MMFEKGFFGGLFDFNNDGKLDFFEQMADAAAFSQLMSEEEEAEDRSDDFAFSPSYSDDASVLSDAGLDEFELGIMDEDERIAALEEAGLDPDDFDF